MQAPESEPSQTDPAPAILLVGVALAFFLLVLLRHAWLSDDAFITFRTVRNFIEGRGMRWNPHERVQTFTHPLWFFLLCAGHFITREAYVSTLVLSFVLSMATVCLVAFRLSHGVLLALLGLAILVSCKSFVDYGTSGLENPLTHFLLVLFVLRWLSLPWRKGTLFSPEPTEESPSPRRLASLGFIGCLLALNRLDTILLVLPALGWEVWRSRRCLKRALFVVVAVFMPLAVWEIVSIIYFGFPFPNTAYAKLGARIPTLAIVQQGGFYYLAELAHDPLALVAIVLGFAAPFLAGARRLWPLVAGGVLYGLYIVRAGGDFMAGRFFSAMVLLAVIFMVLTLAKVVARTKAPVWLPAVFVLAAGLVLTPRPTLTSDAAYPRDGTAHNIDARGITDERAWHYAATALLRRSRSEEVEGPLSSYGRSLKPGSVSVHGVIGAFGYAADPTAIIIDKWALTDPLLARLPAADPQNWRVGHVERAIPAGYVETLQRGQPLIANKNIAEFHAHLTVITQGPIFTAQRFKEIWRFNRGRYDYLVDAPAK